MENVIAMGAIIGLIGAVQKQFPVVKGLLGIALSVVLGIVLGYFGYFDVTSVEQGILVGLGASGVYTVAKRAGGK